MFTWFLNSNRLFNWTTIIAQGVVKNGWCSVLRVHYKNCMVNLKNVFLPVFEAIQVLEEVGNAAHFSLGVAK